LITKEKNQVIRNTFYSYKPHKITLNLITISYMYKIWQN